MGNEIARELNIREKEMYRIYNNIRNIRSNKT